MAEVIKDALEIHRQKSIAPLFREAARSYIGKLSAMGVHPKHLATVGHRARAICAAFGEVRMCFITPAMVESFLSGLKGKKGGACAPSTRRGYMGIIHAVFEQAKILGYEGKSPVDALPMPAIRLKEPETLSPEACRAVLRHVAEKEKKYLPGFVLGLFCGVRPAEIARLRYADLFPGGEDEIYLSRDITKNFIARRTKLRTAVAWLEYAKAQGASMEPGEYVLPGDTEERRQDRYARLMGRISKCSGVYIPRDSLRHTAVTMLSITEGKMMAAEEMGHNEKVLVKHYRRAVPRDEAKAFFEITPASLGL